MWKIEKHSNAQNLYLAFAHQLFELKVSLDDICGVFSAGAGIGDSLLRGFAALPAGFWILPHVCHPIG